TRFKQGDIITFQKDSILVTHRIIEVLVEGKEYITKGDANDRADSDTVSSENIIGEFNGFTIPYIGYITNLTNSKIGMALFLIVPGVLLVFYSFFTIWGVIQRIE